MLDQLNRAHRELGSRDAGEDAGRAVLMKRTYDAVIDDVWDACTNPDRIARWLAPVSGDLQLGGTYQLEGNAGGEIKRCEPPKLLRVSWIFGDNPASAVEVRLAEVSSEETAFELEHMVVDADPDFWQQFGPGAVGVGWDLALLGLAAHLQGEDYTQDPAELLQTPEAKEFMTASSQAWGAAHEASGVSAEEAKGATDRTIAAYTADA
ncbi:MAG: polyketide cyclase [Streptosporangiales bacterium]|nr:polyketide cyclase [Streptosporangiales bacterium]